LLGNSGKIGGMGWLPDDIETLRAFAMAALARADIAEAEAARLVAEASAAAALLLAARLENEKLRRALYGQRSERTARLQDQLELEFEEAETTASQDELAAELAAAKTTTVQAFTRARPLRKPFPEHLPRERVVVPGPTACPCCGSEKLCKLGETITETLESIPRQWMAATIPI
jgi:transposase